MNKEPKVNYHITDFKDFNRVCLENKGLAFPELEKVLEDYILSQPRETMEFKECWIEDEQVVEGEIRKVQVNFFDHNMGSYIRLWGSKNNDNDQVLNMKVDAIDLETKEIVYERQLS
ncbi:hypothetical protein [Halobacillus sp. H74]|uniref:hypothetical protein n=1 Tax=Halobacillus sp. H74 TaxID=3457436 RepID=UPI003FCD7098